MKLLIVYHCGLSQDAKAFYREYVKQGVDLAVIVPSKIVLNLAYSPSPSVFGNSEDHQMGWQFFPVDLRKPNVYSEGFKFFQLFSTIKKIHPDVIQVLDEYTSFYLFQVIICRNLLFGKKVPVIAYASQNDSFYFKSPPFVFVSLPRFFKRIFHKILQPIVFHFHNKYLHGIMGCNSECLKIIESVGGNMPKKLIFWGVDFSRFYSKNRALCRKNLAIPQDIKIVGYVGRLTKEKGLDTLVKAISKIEGYYLALIGKGDYEEELNKIIDSLGLKERIFRDKNIKIEKLTDYYNSFDVFVLPSQTVFGWKEQYGRVLVEAMSCGIPIVASSSGAIVQTLSGYPKGLIFKEGDVEDLIKKIKEAENLKFPENFNLDKFLYKFGVENFAREHIKFFKELLSG